MDFKLRLMLPRQNILIFSETKIIFLLSYSQMMIMRLCTLETGILELMENCKISVENEEIK